MLKQSLSFLTAFQQSSSAHNEPPERRGVRGWMSLSWQLLWALKSLALLSAVIPWGFTPPHFDFLFFFSLMLHLEACYKGAFLKNH